MTIVLFHEYTDTEEAEMPAETGFCGWFWKGPGAYGLPWHGTTVWCEPGRQILPKHSHSQTLADQMVGLMRRTEADVDQTTIYLKVTGEDLVPGELHPEVVELEALLSHSSDTDLGTWLRAHPKKLPILNQLAHRPPVQRGHAIPQ